MSAEENQTGEGMEGVLHEVKRDSMVLFRSMTDALRELEPMEFYSMMFGIIDYAMDDIEPEFPTTLEMALWQIIKPQIDANKRKFEAQVENGRKGGRPKKQTETQENPIKPNKTQKKPTKTLYEKCDMRNEICVPINPSSSCACAREGSEEFDVLLESYDDYRKRKKG